MTEPSDLEFAAQVAAIMHAMKREDCHPGGTSLELEVTACIPVYNAIKALPSVLDALALGEQSVPLALIFAENGSEDGTQLLVRSLAENSVTRKWWMNRGFRDMRVVEVPQNEDYPVEHRARMHYNLRECYRAMFEKVTTPYVLTVDADVEAPRGGVRTMLEALKRDPRIGIVGIQYTPATGHVEHGMAMMATALARELAAGLEMKPPYPCPCSQFQAMATAKQLKVIHLSPLSARHWRLEG